MLIAQRHDCRVRRFHVQTGVLDKTHIARGAPRPHTHTDHCWQLYFDTNLAISETFRTAGYPVPESYIRMKQSA